MAIKWLDAKRLQGSSTGQGALGSVWVQATGGSDSTLDTEVTRRGEKIEDTVPSGNLGKATFALKKSGTPSGTAYCKLYATDGTTVTEVAEETYDNSSLTTSFVDKTFTFDGVNPLTADCRVVIEVTGGDGGIIMNKNVSTAGSPSDIDATHYTGSWGDEATDRSYVGEIFTYAIVDEKTTVTDVPNGTIFNETDTYKYFMFDGTDTWNQMVSS